jgi:hypothetical protein
MVEEEQQPHPPRECSKCPRIESPRRVIQFSDTETGRVTSDMRDFKFEYRGYADDGHEKNVVINEDIETSESRATTIKADNGEEE